MPGSFLQRTVVAGWFCLAPASAQAFTIQNALTQGCHERITATAFRATRQEFATARPLPLSGEDKPMIDDAAFDIPKDMRDIGGAALLFSIREPDLSSRGSYELDELTKIHGDPNSQQAHCLRNEGDDDPDGAQNAIKRCRDHIINEFTLALDALDATGTPDPSIRVKRKITLGMRGRVEVQIPAFHLHLAAAMHATQDAFTHHFRTEDGLRVTTVVNWIDWINQILDEGRDGPEHLRAMDFCEGDPVLDQRRQLAETASRELFRAAYDPSLTREQRLVLVNELADKYLTFQAGCDASNRWCDAREL
jgi:hypothetical protein